MIAMWGWYCLHAPQSTETMRQLAYRWLLEDLRDGDL